MAQKNKKLFSLRSRVILTLSLLVIVVSSTLLYFSADMIYQDKRAYLYEDSFQSVQSSLKQLDASLSAKVRMVEATLPENEGIDGLDLKFWAMDEHLNQIKKFEYNEGGMTLNEVLWENVSLKQNNSKKLHPRSVSYQTIDDYFPETREKGITSGLIQEPKSPPRFFVMIHVPAAQSFVLYDFLIDQLLLDAFGALAYDVTIMKRDGSPFYHNKPFNVSTAQKAFYKSFIGSLKPETGESGVKELVINKVPHILAFKRSEIYKNFYTIAAIKTSEAYEVTTVFILNTTLYALALVGIFNIIALFLARSISKPLDELNRTIKSISEGKYNARVEPQKIMELELVGISFNVMVDKIQEYNARLEEYNRSLEQKVADRTRQLSDANNFIHAMVDSLSQGLLVFDKDGICHSTYTKACTSLLGMSPDGMPVTNLINYEDTETFNSWISTLYDEPMPFEDLLPFGPQFIPVEASWKDESFKHVGLEFFAMRGDESKIENIVMVATDKTKEFQASKENEVQQSYIMMLSKVLKDKVNFTRFVSQYRIGLGENIGKKDVDRMGLMRLVHSYKGMGGFYGLKEVVEYLHLLENDLILDTYDMNLVDARLEDALRLMELVETQIKEFSPELGTQSEKLEIEEEKLLEFYEMLRPMDEDYAQHFKNSFMDGPVETYVEQYKNMIQDLARQLGKKVNPLIINNGSLKVDRKAFQKFFDSCIHLFRNSIDHGIESPEKRLSRGKDESGTISLTFEIRQVSGNKFLYFEMKDDGGGINKEAIKRKMRSLGYPEAEIEEKDERLIFAKIFDAQFSTAETTTEISGRGIGLFDIQEQVLNSGGNIMLETQPDKGTTFSFFLKIV
ncbi:MAG TPA: ATP-binding protein [Bacteriovoracaceae bacterium]|nr:ATP-binding protein [Bacteriovoracaceae bacterium]